MLLLPNPRCRIGHWSHVRAPAKHRMPSAVLAFVSMPRRTTRQQQQPASLTSMRYTRLRRTAVPRRMSSSAVYIEPNSDCFVLSAPPSQAQPYGQIGGNTKHSTEDNRIRVTGGYTMYSHFVSAKPRVKVAQWCRCTTGCRLSVGQAPDHCSAVAVASESCNERRTGRSSDS